MKQDSFSGALPSSLNSNVIGIILNSILTSSSNFSAVNVPAVIRDSLKSRFVSSTHAAAGPETSLLITLGLIFCFLSFVFQLTWFTMGLRYSKMSHSHWVVRRNEVGVFIPNTRFLMAIFSVFFTLLLVCENVLLILDMNGVSTLKDRTIIAVSKWLPLWVSSWVFSWGMASSIYTTYSKIPKGIIGKVVGCKHSARYFNTAVFGSLTLVIIYETTVTLFTGYGLMCRLDTFHRFFVRFEVMAVLFDPKNFAIKNELLPELPGLLAMTQSFENWSKDFRFLLCSRLAYFLGFICICLPLYCIYFRLIRKMTKRRNNINLHAMCAHNRTAVTVPPLAEENGCYVQYSTPELPWRVRFLNWMCFDDTHLILAAILSLGHSLLEVIVMIRFLYLLKTSGTISAQVTLLTKTGVINNFIFGITGLLSSWIFFTRSRLNYSKPLPCVKNLTGVERNLVTTELFETELFETCIMNAVTMGAIFSLSGDKKQESYFAQVRPRLKHFPDIMLVKQFYLSEKDGAVDHSMSGALCES
ncbi:hypothetical protein PCANC_08823 [Puccinia coronata f. sp. avenae]|uniref:Uncharacterized protein n=1 Tax=Puccinia coronata f. sp. avenae TaxID=200324 RepID=A0A2N5SYU5_9BASI|nr:hypothetical protein PCANC_08823 [Puccinia coronata f. sp. avenae]